MAGEPATTRKQETFLVGPAAAALVGYLVDPPRYEVGILDGILEASD